MGEGGGVLQQETLAPAHCPPPVSYQRAQHAGSLVNTSGKTEQFNVIFPGQAHHSLQGIHRGFRGQAGPLVAGPDWPGSDGEIHRP